MTTEAQVRKANSPQEALLVIARAIDGVFEEVRKQPASEPDPWGDWSGPLTNVDDFGAQGNAQAKVDDLKERYEAAEGEDKRALEAEVRLAEDELAEVKAITGPDDGDHSQVEIEGDGVTYNLPTVSGEKLAQRREFAEKVLKLHEYYKNDEYLDSYAKGGPLLLYYSDRDFVVGLSDEWKVAMVKDVAEQSPQEAFEMGRDILKDTGTGFQDASVERVLANVR